MRAKNYRRTRYSFFHSRRTTFFFLSSLTIACDFVSTQHFFLSFARLHLLRGTQEPDGVAVSVSICSQDLFGWRWFHLHVRFYRASKTFPCIWIKLFGTRERTAAHTTHSNLHIVWWWKEFLLKRNANHFSMGFSRTFSAFCQMYWEQSRITFPKRY